MGIVVVVVVVLLLLLLLSSLSSFYFSFLSAFSSAINQPTLKLTNKMNSSPVADNPPYQRGLPLPQEFLLQLPGSGSLASALQPPASVPLSPQP